MLCCMLTMNAQSWSTTVAQEGAWCWFADPRALHYENSDGTINATYIGYIDVHGNVKATQYDFLTMRKTDVLVRSFFQPDDHNNPTFLVLPDERIIIFYTRHTDEPKIWYRISTRPGDITALGEEKYLSTANNTTYPSPFILSDDPQHIYLCWRGINWHPTIARITMPDEAGNCHFDFGPKQIVQSTGARPYAKYASNGSDKIYLCYTTGHPDNEMPNWLYFNVIDIDGGNGPILRDMKGQQLAKISNGVFNVAKTDSYANTYPNTIVDRTANIRNWVWQIALDGNENPVIAYTHIDNAKTTHAYWYARWNGTEWKRTQLQQGGHAFHQNWNKTELCYSGGMAIDPHNTNDIYLSIPTRDGKYSKDGVYEIWQYTIDEEETAVGKSQITTDSQKNNIRPFVIPGSNNSPLRLAWMQGDYYYWMVNKSYPQGYPTSILCNHSWQEEPTVEPNDPLNEVPTCFCFGTNETLTLAFEMDAEKYEGTLFTVDGTLPLEYSISTDDQRPVVTVGGKSYKSQNRLLTSDEWANASNGTNGDNHPTKLKTWVLTMTYDGQVLTAYRNGLVDQVIEVAGLDGIVSVNGQCVYHDIDYVCHSPIAVQQKVEEAKEEIKHHHNQNLPTELRNGNFEGSYTPMQGSGVSNDRAIYVPEGWTVEYTARNENDLTALKAGDLFFDRFFAQLPHPADGGSQTYWVRQNWGTSTITLSQELLLPEGEYTLTANVWKSGLGGDAYVRVMEQDGPTVSAPALQNKEAWQKVNFDFTSDGIASTTVSLTAMHNNNGTEKIIGFDNVSLNKKVNTAIPTAITGGTHRAAYDMGGRPQQSRHTHGVTVSEGRKILNK